MKLKPSLSQLIFVVAGLFVGAALASVYHSITAPKEEEVPIHRGTITGTYRWPVVGGNDVEYRFEQADYQKPLAEETVPTKSVWHDVEAKHSDFSIKAAVLAPAVQDFKVLELDVTTKAELTVFDKDIQFRPRTPGLKIDYMPFKVKKKSKPWMHVDILVGAEIVPPYNPVIGLGAGLERLPFGIKLPNLTFGMLIQIPNNPSFYINYRLRW